MDQSVECSMDYYERKWSDPSDMYAAPVMLDACQCPHLDAVLPTLLQVEGCGLLAKSGTAYPHSKTCSSSMELIHSWHMKSDTSSCASSSPTRTVMSYPFGKEQFKFDVVASGGLSDYYCPLVPPRYTQRLESRYSHRKRHYPHTTQDKATDEQQQGTEISPSQERFNQLLQRQEKLYKMKQRLMTSSSSSPSTSATHTLVSPKESKAMGTNSLGKPIAKAKKKGCIETDGVHQEKERQTILHTSTQVEFWMQTLQENRLRYWNNHEYIRRKQKEKNGSSHPPGTWSPISCHWCSQTTNHPPYIQSDAFMQCLQCSVIACGPLAMDTTAPFLPKTREHIRQHFLLSGHSLGITCGPLAAIYCMSCGDYIHHDAFESEIQRIAIRFNARDIGWERNRTIIRSFQCLDFIVTPDPLFGTTRDTGWDENMLSDVGTVVWRGFRAAYPSAESRELQLAASLTILRMQIFQGDFLMKGSAMNQALHHTMEKATSALSVAPLPNHGRLVLKIQAPLGMFNLGNSCFFNSVMQCLVHCASFQRFFLVDVKHNYLACPHLRRAHTTDHRPHSICLGCEMDKIILSVYSGVNGVDTRRILEDAINDQRSTSQCSSSANVGPNIRGTPIVLSEMLIAVRKCRSMSRLRGHEQHDAHEFLQEFLDTLGKHCRSYTKQLNKLREEASSCSFKTVLNDTLIRKNSVDGDVSKDIFGGELRSLLICGTCGHKRTQMEPYLNISLPLAKETIPGDETVTNSDGGMYPIRSNLSLSSCLKHFTTPESLFDPVYCEDCGMKTPTWKQHTFAKLPRVLCFHLKRFDFLKKKKITDPVGFPVSVNMGTFLPGWTEVIQGDTHSLSNWSMMLERQNDTDVSATAPLVMYDLYATIDHTGSLNQGHYVSNVKVNGKWYNCNDSFVSHMDEAAILKSENVYMLFYSRRQ